MQADEIERDFVALLSYVYGAINWKGIRTSKNPWDIWNHRVRFAAGVDTIDAYVSRLSNQFGLQSLPVETLALCDALRPHAAVCLNLAYREHIPLAMRAVMLAKERQAARKRAKEEERAAW